MFEEISKVIFLLILALTAAPGYSELDINEAVRDTDLFDDKKIIEKIWSIPEPLPEIKPEEVPPPEIEESFFIKKINLVGVESLSVKDLAYLVEKYENKKLTLSELGVLAKEIEEKYLEKGIIAAVFIPPQEIRQETVVLQVVEARMGELDIQEHKYFKKGRLGYYWSIPGGEVLRFEKISRSIQMMNKNPDRKVKVNLRAGKAAGTTDVVLGADTKFPLHATWSADREGTVPTGRNRNTFGIRHNNLLGLDDMFLGGYSFGREFSGIYGYHNLPISPVGTSMLYGFSLSRANPKKEYEPFGVHAKALNVSLSFHQDLFKKDQYLGEIFFGAIAKDKVTTINTGTYSRDRLRILNLGGNFIFQNILSSTILNPQLFQGIDGFGSSSKGNPLASREASSVFTKFNFKAEHKRRLPFFNLQADIKFDSQVSSGKLMPQEEFMLGGIDSVRGYPSADYLADNAALCNAELLIPSFFIPEGWKFLSMKEPLRKKVTLVAFLDRGWGKRRSPLETDKSSVNFLGVGAGIRINVFEHGVLRLEWAAPVGDDPITEESHSRFHFSLDVQS